MKKVLLLLLISLVFQLIAQDDFEKWLEDQNRNFVNWKNQRDKEFTEFLSKPWSVYEIRKPVQRDSVPKPGNVPLSVEQNDFDLKSGGKIKLDREVIDQSVVPDIISEISRHQMLYAVEEGIETLRIDFWGINLPFSYNINMKINYKLRYTPRGIADFWGAISNTDFEMLLESLQTAKEKFTTSDWGYCQMIYKTGCELYGSEDMGELFTWFVLTKNGYDCKIGYNENGFYLLLATTNTIYGEPHLVFDDRDYYCISFHSEQLKLVDLYTYDGSYPEADDLIDLNLENSPWLEEVLVEKVLRFTYKDTLWEIPVEQNLTLVEFLSGYPATDLKVYFSADLSPQVKASLFRGLSPILRNRTEAEALNILLRFVQTAFQYRTDDEQFGAENSLFPDETLYYDYSDCEDRSFLFSYLVREFLALDVIGLDYPGHIATAVELKFDIGGDKINYNGIDYLICDPTYINADIGVTMPQFVNREPRIIQFCD